MDDTIWSFQPKVLWSEASLPQEIATTKDFVEKENKGMKVFWATEKFHYQGLQGVYDINFLLLGGHVGLGESVRTGFNILEEGNKVMQWFLHEDSYSPGNKMSLSCTATFNSTTPINQENDIEVRSYYGALSWT